MPDADVIRYIGVHADVLHVVLPGPVQRIARRALRPRRRLAYLGPKLVARYARGRRWGCAP